MISMKDQENYINKRGQKSFRGLYNIPNDPPDLKRLKSEFRELEKVKVESTDADEKILLLPDEILLKIFKYLSTYDILKRIAPVCKDFYRISKDSRLIRKIELFNDNAKHTMDEVTEPDYLFEVVERSKNLEILILRNGNDIEELAITALQMCPNLRHLEIKYFQNYPGLHLTDYFMETLEKFGQQLHYLDLFGGCRNG